MCVLRNGQRCRNHDMMPTMMAEDVSTMKLLSPSSERGMRLLRELLVPSIVKVGVEFCVEKKILRSREVNGI